MNSARRRWVRRTGVVLLALGLVMLGWGAWQYWGTTWQSQQRHDEITGKLEESWRSGDAVAKVDEGVATAVVRIPAFGADYAVPLLEGTSDEVLAAGFGHLDGTADPGEIGNFAIAGHRVTHGEPLADMPSLEVGDRIIIDTATRTFTYELDTGGDDLTVRFDQTWVLDPLPTNPDPAGPEPAQEAGQRLLTLTTCAELFHTDDRLVAFGHLVSDQPR
jgi:sortase A